MILLERYWKAIRVSFLTRVKEKSYGESESTSSKTPEGYCATVDILPGFIVAVTGDFSELKKELFESVDFYVECAKADGDVYPEVLNQEYEFEYKFDVESLLFFYEKILSKAALERLTGINQKQLSHYACGRSKPRPAQAQKIVNALHTLGRDLLAISV